MMFILSLTVNEGLMELNNVFFLIHNQFDDVSKSNSINECTLNQKTFKILQFLI